ncbi:MAG TPA: hypothetical protein VL202_07695 [Pararhizobium sp.]|uniref:hypothetical protein n=1 Tax=Pararhizobium sp. TaxID=1977563 RepID=UPI002C9E0F96|nr:hypothetical protein [Pararhizobium sp.]HTO31041.1 hypothetical protein [Pararhizobium sp.]
MKLGDSISSYYRSQNTGQTSGSAASSLLIPTDGGSQRTQAPTVSIGGSASSSSLSSALWLSMADKMEADTGSLTEAPKGPADEFMEWSRMSLAEKIRAQILGEKGLTEEDLAGMDADARAAIEAEIKEAIKRQLVGIEGKGDLTTTDATSL